ncbi:uncharacterized protein LOC128321673 [Pangasianodon hypophthalmus]|uniref:uncharacterized protein LOC128321673 n=1 Tax=Pangasianodon hypophthalmus TaxID=310915 RepID=UPI0023072FBE|nr:uncharacterized protein LOC128321673 [Pangasianodon hypophthalmus]
MSRYLRRLLAANDAPQEQRDGSGDVVGQTVLLLFLHPEEDEEVDLLALVKEWNPGVLDSEHGGLASGTELGPQGWASAIGPGLQELRLPGRPLVNPSVWWWDSSMGLVDWLVCYLGAFEFSILNSTQLILSFPPSDSHVSARISACLADISSWMTTHQLKLNPTKTELLFIPCDSSPSQDLAISPSVTARNLGVTMDNQLSFSSHIANLTRSCRFLLYNIRRIRPFLSSQATQVLVQSLVISRLDYCNSLLAGLPLSAIRPLQLIQNAAARLVFNLPKFSHTTPLLRSLHWLPVAARIRFKTLMLAYKAKNRPAPTYLKALITPRAPPRSLRSSSTARLVPPSLRVQGRHASRLFSVLAPRWWNELPLDVRTAESLAVFKRRLKTYLFIKYLN